MRERVINVLLIAFFLIFSAESLAGVVIGGTRIIYNSDKSDVTLSIFNKDVELPYLIQVWVDPFSASDAAKAPFTAIPPVSRIEPQQEKILRIIKTQGELPKDRESVFWLNVKNIPPRSTNKDGSALELAIKTRIKLFWRPSSINIIPENAAPQVKWHREGNQLVAENPTPIHINVMDVSVDGQDIPLNMIRPFETVKLPLPANVSGATMLWHYINDYGAVSQDITLAL
nr:fimbrial chaperone [uncultured Enterobacter sp.]